jgi:hypothetical protein
MIKYLSAYENRDIERKIKYVKYNMTLYDTLELDFENTEIDNLIKLIEDKKRKEITDKEIEISIKLMKMFLKLKNKEIKPKAYTKELYNIDRYNIEIIIKKLKDKIEYIGNLTTNNEVV